MKDPHTGRVLSKPEKFRSDIVRFLFFANPI